MDTDLKAKIRLWKAGMELHNEFVLEEKRNRTPAERLRLHQAFLEGHAQIGISRQGPDARVHYMPYSEVQRRLSGRDLKVVLS